MYVQIDLPHVGLLESKLCIGAGLGKVEEFWGEFPPIVPVTHLQYTKHTLLDIRYEPMLRKIDSISNFSH